MMIKHQATEREYMSGKQAALTVLAISAGYLIGFWLTGRPDWLASLLLGY